MRQSSLILQDQGRRERDLGRNERVLEPIEKEGEEVVMAQVMVEPELWLAAAVAAHFFFHLFFLGMFRHVLHGLAANLRAAAAAAGKLVADCWRV